MKGDGGRSLLQVGQKGDSKAGPFTAGYSEV